MSPNAGFESSERRAAIYDFIETYWRDHGFAPSMRDIAAGTGTGLTTVKYHMTVLRENRLIAYTPKASRTVHITAPFPDEKGDS